MTPKRRRAGLGEFAPTHQATARYSQPIGRKAAMAIGRAAADCWAASLPSERQSTALKYR
jgi:hypothetical protein